MDDGYAIMYHDAFNVVAQAVDQTYNDVNDSDEKGGARTPPIRSCRPRTTSTTP
ncbi:hypothetical protein NKH18_18210 [Streptomyces sp. M10(2022)]